MKKNFYYLSLILGLVFGMTMFTACGSDGEDNGGSSGGGETGFVPGKFMGPTRVFGNNLVSSFGSDNTRYELTYNSDNFVTKLKEESIHDGQVVSTKEYEVTYSDKQVIINRTKSGSERVRQYVFTIGTNGYAETMTEGYTDSDNKYVSKYEYDADGHVIKVTDEDVEYPWSASFTWQEGNIIEEKSDESSINYTYTDINNDAGLFIMADIGGMDDLYLPEFYYMGLLGKGTAKLVQSSNNSSKSRTVENAWTLDDAGRPTKCVKTTTYYYGDTSSTSTTTYTWSYK